MTRRTVLGILAGVIHGVAAFLFAIPALRFLWPARRRGGTEFVRVVPLSALNSKSPTRVAVIAERNDGFLRFPATTIGQVWLDSNNSDPSPAEVRCLQTICPHLGCSIDFDPARDAFTCRCHTSDFARDGARRTGPSPRDMDSLECRVTTPDDGGNRWIEVRYIEFKTGTAQREPLV